MLQRTRNEAKNVVLKLSISQAAFRPFGFFTSIRQFAINLTSQGLYGSLVGTVTDPSGAVVPNAAISVTSTATGQVRQDTSDQNGRYNFVNLLPGSYTVVVSANGFRKVRGDKSHHYPEHCRPF